MLDRKTGLALLILAIAAPASFAQDLKGGVQKTDVIPQPTYVPDYGAPQMVGPAPTVRPPVKPAVKPPKPKATIPQQPRVDTRPKTPVLNTGINTGAQRPMTMQQPVQGVLPPQFLGRWQVLGSRSAVEAQPQYQSGIDNIFSMTTSNSWTIQGSPEQGYVLNTDTGVSTPLMVESQGNTAILRYQHPIKNTMAQEALVMQLGPGGAQFDGLERISIVKQGEPQPRAKVTYKLVGHRQ